MVFSKIDFQPEETCLLQLSFYFLEFHTVFKQMKNLRFFFSGREISWSFWCIHTYALFVRIVLSLLNRGWGRILILCIMLCQLQMFTEYGVRKLVGGLIFPPVRKIKSRGKTESFSNILCKWDLLSRVFRLRRGQGCAKSNKNNYESLLGVRRERLERIKFLWLKT